MGLTQSIQGRALRIIQALITTTENHGHKANTQNHPGRKKAASVAKSLNANAARIS